MDHDLYLPTEAGEVSYMQCLRKIAHVSLWDQEHWSLTNSGLRLCLGVPAVTDMVSQARLRWLGHVARMDSSRLPKRMTFAFLPAAVGVARPVGRRAGKWLQETYVEDLNRARVALSTWMHKARDDHGRPWRRMVYHIAPVHGAPPATSRILSVHFFPPTRVLAHEAALGGRANLWTILQEELTSSLGSHWARLTYSNTLTPYRNGPFLNIR